MVLQHRVKQEHNKKIIKTLESETTMAFLIKYGYEVLLRNVEKEEEEEGEYMVYYTNLRTTRQITRTELVRSVIDSFEKHRLDFNKIKTPNTEWVFKSFYRVSVKLIFDRNNVLVGAGRLPERLKH